MFKQYNNCIELKEKAEKLFPKITDVLKPNKIGYANFIDMDLVIEYEGNDGYTISVSNGELFGRHSALSIYDKYKRRMGLMMVILDKHKVDYREIIGKGKDNGIGFLEVGFHIRNVTDEALAEIKELLRDYGQHSIGNNNTQTEEVL